MEPGEYAQGSITPAQMWELAQIRAVINQMKGLLNGKMYALYNFLDAYILDEEDYRVNGWNSATITDIVGKLQRGEIPNKLKKKETKTDRIGGYGNYYESARNTLDEFSTYVDLAQHRYSGDEPIIGLQNLTATKKNPRKYTARGPNLDSFDFNGFISNVKKGIHTMNERLEKIMSGQFSRSDRKKRKMKDPDGSPMEVFFDLDAEMAKYHPPGSSSTSSTSPSTSDIPDPLSYPPGSSSTSSTSPSTSDIPDPLSYTPYSFTYGEHYTPYDFSEHGDPFLEKEDEGFDAEDGGFDADDYNLFKFLMENSNSAEKDEPPT